MRSDCLVLCSVVTNVYCFCSYITKYSHADFKAIPTKPSAYLTGFPVISNCQELSLAQMLCFISSWYRKGKILSTLSITRFADIVQCDIVHVPSFKHVSNLATLLTSEHLIFTLVNLFSPQMNFGLNVGHVASSTCKHTQNYPISKYF